jgi:hypothetical protein
MARKETIEAPVNSILHPINSDGGFFMTRIVDDL